jgi:hypothetical protein
MSPRKTILLAGENLLRMQLHRYRLQLNYFAVQIVERAEEALTLLLRQHYAVLIVDMPLRGAEILLDAAKVIDPGTKTLLLMERGAPLILTADATILPECATARMLLDHVKMLAPAKRGPRIIRKPVGSVSVFLDEIKKLD